MRLGYHFFPRESRETFAVSRPGYFSPGPMSAADRPEYKKENILPDVLLVRFISQCCSASESARSSCGPHCSCAAAPWRQPCRCSSLRHLVSALGLGAIAVNGSSLELLDSSLQCGLFGFVAGIARLCHQNTLLSRLDIRQTKHLPDDQFRASEITSTQDDILALFLSNCKSFFEIFRKILNIF